jgi:hypothetical protein
VALVGSEVLDDVFLLSQLKKSGFCYLPWH